MAGTSLLALLDDIATILDDVSLMTKVAAKKTVGVLGDDLALNAEQVSGVKADRELPVVWAVAKGSMINKLILVPAALAISAVAPWLITPLLMLGGAFLCYEGFEKVFHALFHNKKTDAVEHKELIDAVTDPHVNMVQFEKDKIKGAIRTDFILSAEIIVIALGTVKDASFTVQVAVVAGIAFIMTIGVYTLVAGIVKLDDAGLYLIKNKAVTMWDNFKHALGRGILVVAPYLMKTLSIVGTAAMFLVGGSILLHGFPWAHHMLQDTEAAVEHLPTVGTVLSALTPTLFNLATGLMAGAVLVAGMTAVSKTTKLFKAKA